MRWRRPGYHCPSVDSTETLLCDLATCAAQTTRGLVRLDSAMKKYYGHTLLYLHETISLGSGRSDRFTEVFTDTYQPMMDELGARLFAIWESTPYNGHWPQVTIIWEIDGFADYAQDRCRPGPRRQPRGRGRQMVGVSGRHRRSGGGPNHVPRAQQQDCWPSCARPISLRRW